MRAQCLCGDLHADVPGPADTIVACHCTDCQRRSGSPFGVIAYYPASAVSLHGTPSEYTRIAESGAGFTQAFCPRCGTTVWCRADKHPDAIGIPVGTIADPGYPRPVRSVWEDRRHAWVAMPEDIAHFPRGRR